MTPPLDHSRPRPHAPVDGLIFLSYSTLDKEMAGAVKDGLEVYGFEAFLAHEDMVPSEEWKRRIQEELRRCNVFMPLVSKNFRQSEWTDQEVGYALSRIPECMVLSLQVPPINVHGFLKDLQALDVQDMKHVPIRCEEVALAIDKRGGIGSTQARRARVIEKFARSNSYAAAGRNVRGLLGFTGYPQREMDRIFLACIANAQIYEPNEVRRHLNHLFSQHGHVASSEVMKDFVRKFHW